MSSELILNLGSGKDYRADCINVDINPQWNPDYLEDITKPLSDFLLSNRGEFDRIIAYDVLEHLPNLVQAMTNCRDLLKIGGEMEILVPYDLAFGAWQDPTHVRAFNERSFWYYCEWFWYLGWKGTRFTTTRLQYNLSEKGLDLHRKGVALEEILLTPRMVESLFVVLTKIEVL